jgi:peroxiredoxin
MRLVHAEEFADLHALLSTKTELTGMQLAGMYWLGQISGSIEASAADQWREKLLQEAGGHPLAVYGRAVEIVRSETQPPDALVRLDSLWLEAGPRNTRLARLGLQLAMQVGDSPSILRWADRRASREPWVATSDAISLLNIPELRGEGLHRLRKELRRLDEQAELERDLGQTMSRWATELANRRNIILAYIGKGLVEFGRVNQGLDTLQLAAASGWDVSVFRTVAEVMLEKGDTVDALEVWAQVVVDPATSDALRDSIGALATETLGAAAWTRHLEEAGSVMQERSRASALSISLPRAIPLLDSYGDRLRFSELIGAMPVVVAFWSRSCVPSLNQLPQLQLAAEDLEAQGIAMVAITAERPSADLARFVLQKRIRFPVYHDVEGRAASAFNSWGTPAYFVVDAHRRIRFQHIALESVMRLANSLVAVDVVTSDLDPGNPR